LISSIIPQHVLPVEQAGAKLLESDYWYNSLVIKPALRITHNRLLRDCPTDVADYIYEFHSKIKSEIEAEASASRVGASASPLEHAEQVHSPASPEHEGHASASATAAAGKFDTFVMPGGKIEDFYKGLSSRIGFPHLEFFKTMEAEHCSMAGCSMQFTTRNYGITTEHHGTSGVGRCCEETGASTRAHAARARDCPC
jgi:hypothetical protein